MIPVSSNPVVAAATLEHVRTLVKSVMESGSAELVFANPVLLSNRWLQTLSSEDDQEIHVAVEALQDSAREIDGQPWPFGTGPLDDLFTKVQEGHMTEPAARKLAAQADVYWRVSPRYVRRLAKTAEAWARDGEWRDGVLLLKLVLAMLDARRGQLAIDQDEMELSATIHWLDVVTRAVCDLPDGRLFRDAAQRGEKWAHVITDPDGSYKPAAVLQALGILHLDPYVGGRTNAGYEAQIRAWQDRFRLALGATDSPFFDKETMSVPTPAEALQKAAHYLGLAAQHRTGEDLGWTLKARVQALVWHWEVGLTPPADEPEQLVLKIRQLLRGREYETVHLEMQNFLRLHASKRQGAEHAVDVDPRRIARLLKTPVSPSLQGRAADDLRSDYMQTASAIRKQDPLSAFLLWSAVQPVGWRGSEAQRGEFFRAGMSFIARAYPLETALSPDYSAVDAYNEIIDSRQASEDVRAAKLLALVFHCTSVDQEEVALEILERVLSYEGEFKHRHEQFLALARPTLLIGAAVNHFNAGDHGEAARLYMEAADGFVDCGSADAALDAIEKAADLGERGSARAIEYLVAMIEDAAVRLETTVPGAAERLQQIYRKALSLMMSGPIKPILLMILFARAKGSAFSRALMHGSPLEWLDTPEALELESQHRELTEKVEAAGLRPAQSDADREMILTGYVSPFERSGGASLLEQQRNLEISFDATLGRALLQRGQQSDWLPTVEAVQSALGPHSVLLAPYIAHTPNGDAAICTLLVSDTNVQAAVGRIPGFASNLMTMQHQGVTVQVSPFALLVSGAREDLQQDPLTRNISPAGAEALHKRYNDLLGGGLTDQLAALRSQGKTHIYVWPHGPLHFMPYHLVGPENAPLAADWTITYLSALQLLDPAREWTADLKELASFGIDFQPGNAKGLPAMLGAEAEASDVAGTADATALTGAAVSKAAVLDALSTHRRVHIATHGELPVSAPSFQCLHLGGDAERLYAYEILRLNLRGVDLVTLSACETSLGRFDVSDNARGFSASLLIAGVSTIVGTLWPVDTHCARRFFVRLYSELHAGSTKGDAFRTAQTAVRKAFPHYRDWGAFYLLGSVHA